MVAVLSCDEATIKLPVSVHVKRIGTEGAGMVTGTAALKCLPLALMASAYVPGASVAKAKLPSAAFCVLARVVPVRVTFCSAP